MTTPMAPERFREILRRTFEQRTLPSGLTVQLRPVGHKSLLAAARVPLEVTQFFLDHNQGVEHSPDEVLRMVVTYRRIEAAASVVEIWDGDHWSDASLDLVDFRMLDVLDQEQLLIYAAEHSELASAEPAGAPA